jgi:GAF domain-containing protein
LRIRLDVHDGLSCVIYVGIAEERRFTASEIRRLESLCSALTIHLDNARLRSDIRQKLDELTTERELREQVVSVFIRGVRGPVAAARSKAQRLLEDPASVTGKAGDIVAILARVETVLDEFLATTPAVSPDPRR